MSLLVVSQRTKSLHAGKRSASYAFVHAHMFDQVFWFAHETPWLERALIDRTNPFMVKRERILFEAGEPAFYANILLSDARCSGAACIEDCAGQAAVAQSLDSAMTRSPKPDVGGGLRCKNHRQ